MTLKYKGICQRNKHTIENLIKKPPKKTKGITEVYTRTERTISSKSGVELTPELSLSSVQHRASEVESFSKQFKCYLLLLIASQSQMYRNQQHPPDYPKDQEIQSAHKTLLIDMRNSMMKRKGKERKRIMHYLLRWSFGWISRQFKLIVVKPIL